MNQKNPHIKEVLLIFKTHLDIGYTDYAEKVTEQYLTDYIPRAIETGYQLKGSDTPFLWTVGSWLIAMALKQDRDGRVEQAIRDGIITWHGLPFTTHTELMSPRLFACGLSLSKELDARFGKTTIGAKLTDVPGHTKGMIPLMRQYGLQFLHIGVNMASPLPEVPPVFRWRCGQDELVVMYEHGYGVSAEFGDFAVVFGHTNDNLGPQSPQAVKEIYAKLRTQYPCAEIKASTLDDLGRRMLQLKNLPVVEREIGDSWIYGTGSDPKKVGMYRELLRRLEETDLQGSDLLDNLLLIPEHTWGMCLQKYFPHMDCWLGEDFQKTEGTPERVAFEKSWEEQRRYVTEAEKVLGVTADYTLREPSLDGFQKIDDAPAPDFEVSYQLFDVQDYDRYLKNYVEISMATAYWAPWDYLKLGLPEYPGCICTARVTAAYQKEDTRLYKLEFAPEAAARYGLPHLWAQTREGWLELQWFGKRANRVPEAFWLKFKGQTERWEIEKLGQWIDPQEILGSPLLAATGQGVRNGQVWIRPLDSALVAPFGRRLLDLELHPTGQDLYFNLYNNLYNTNFPMWYSDDTRFRFEIEKI